MVKSVKDFLALKKNATSVRGRLLFIHDNQEPWIKTTENYSNNERVSPVAWKPMNWLPWSLATTHITQKYGGIPSPVCFTLAKPKSWRTAALLILQKLLASPRQFSKRQWESHLFTHFTIKAGQYVPLQWVKAAPVIYYSSWSRHSSWSKSHFWKIFSLTDINSSDRYNPK